MKDTIDPMGQRVRILRLQRALSQAELAELAGVSRAVVIRLERGVAPPRPATVRKLARALGVAPMKLTVGQSE